MATGADNVAVKCALVAAEFDLRTAAPGVGPAPQERDPYRDTSREL